MNADKEKRPVGAPPKMKDGRKMHVYLDAATIEIAQRLGDGNISEGLRAGMAQQEMLVRLSTALADLLAQIESCDGTSQIDIEDAKSVQLLQR